MPSKPSFGKAAIIQEYEMSYQSIPIRARNGTVARHFV